jgi:hypothetical protein
MLDDIAADTQATHAALAHLQPEGHPGTQLYSSTGIPCSSASTHGMVAAEIHLADVALIAEATRQSTCATSARISRTLQHLEGLEAADVASRMWEEPSASYHGMQHSSQWPQAGYSTLSTPSSHQQQFDPVHSTELAGGEERGRETTIQEAAAAATLVLPGIREGWHLPDTASRHIKHEHQDDNSMHGEWVRHPWLHMLVIHTYILACGTSSPGWQLNPACASTPALKAPTQHSVVSHLSSAACGRCGEGCIRPWICLPDVMQACS